MGRVDGKIAMITGGGQGLGEASARMLVKEGAKVILTDINLKAAQTVAQSMGNSAVAYEHDVTNEDQWKTVLEKAVNHFGGLHVLVNNAGISCTQSIEEISLETWKKVHEVDVDSVFLGCKYAIPYIKKSGGGSIINMSSIAGIIAGHNTPAYNSAKAAVRHLTKSVALHCAKQKNNIRCNSIHPVFVKTPILDGLVNMLGKEEAYAKLGRQIPLGHIGDPEDIAYAVIYLASNESKMMTGAEIVIDGGISAM
jgi:NAD(P)-dependent dehydrogenase (short-subunit alcohol dehydrogenase family)